MTQTRTLATLSLLVLTAPPALAGCRDLADAPIANQTPIANAGPDQTHEVAGEVTVTLDGRDSSDPDGAVVGYRWFSANPPDTDGGTGRGGPDPDDVARPELTLGEGIWTFTLWVEDDQGKLSGPDNVVITVGEPVDPRVLECAMEVEPTVSEACRLCVCDIDDSCRGSAVDCDETCWDLMFCSDEQCADVDPSDTAAYSECVRTNCADLLASGLQVQAFSPCRDQCPEVCSASAQAEANAPQAGPAAECAEALVPSVPDACRTCICDLDDACRQAATDCGQDCWDLFTCTDQMCGDADDLGTCVRTMCADFLGGGVAAQAAGPCRDRCPEACDLSDGG